jgi:hypothetical protein
MPKLGRAMKSDAGGHDLEVASSLSSLATLTGQGLPGRGSERPLSESSAKKAVSVLPPGIQMGVKSTVSQDPSELYAGLQLSSMGYEPRAMMALLLLSLALGYIPIRYLYFRGGFLQDSDVAPRLPCSGVVCAAYDRYDNRDSFAHPTFSEIPSGDESLMLIKSVNPTLSPVRVAWS